MDCGQQFICTGGNDRAGSDRRASGFPTIPNGGKRERRLVFHMKVVRLRDLLVDSLPLVKTIRGNQAAPSLKRLAEGWLLINRLDARIDEAFSFFTPERNQAPLQKSKFSNRVALNDGENVLAGSNVVARDQIVRIDRADDVVKLYALRSFKSKPAAHRPFTLDLSKTTRQVPQPRPFLCFCAFYG